MADQTYDPRLEALLRDVLAAEVADLPLTVGPDRILDRAGARRGARGPSGRGPFSIGRPTLGRLRWSVSLGAIAVLATAVVVLRLSATPDRSSPVAALPTTPDAWTRVAFDARPDLQGVGSLAASPRGLLAVVGVDEGPDELYASTDGHSWTRVPPDRRPPVGQDGAGWALVGSDRGFLLSNGDVWLSADGFDWQLLANRVEDPDLGHGEMQSIAVGGPGYVAVGNGNSAWFSTDGSDWSLAQVPPPPTEYFKSQGFAAPEVDMRGVAVAGDTLVAWGTASRHTEDSGLTAPVMWASDDGRTWSDVLPPGSDQPAAMAVGPGGFVAADEDSGGQIVVRVSADGQTWEQVDALGAARSTDADGRSLELSVSSIAAADAGFVAVGGVGQSCLFTCEPGDVVIWTSADGRSWSRLPSAEAFARAEAADVVSWGDRFVVGGAHDGRPVIWISGSPPAGAGADTAPGAADARPSAGTIDVTAAAFAGRWGATDGTPEPTCARDDGSPPGALDGRPLGEQLGRLSLSYDFRDGAVQDSRGAAWSRRDVTS